MFKMTDESSDAIEIRRAPNGKYYVWENGEVIYEPNGSLRYFETQRDAWTFLTNCDRAEIDKIAAYSGGQRQYSEHGNEAMSGEWPETPPLAGDDPGFDRAVPALD